MATSPSDLSSASDQEFTHPTADHCSFLVRAVRPHDLYSMTEVLARSFHAREGVTGLLYPLLRMGIYEDLRNRLNSKAPHQIFLVAVPYLPIASAQRLAHANLPGTPLAGTVEISQRSFSFWEQQRTRHLYLSNLAVPAEYRRQGVARQLLATCDRIAAEWGIPDLYLHVLENNYPARQLYFKAGYRLHRVDASIGSWLLGQPRQLFLHKRVPLNECAGCQGSDCV